MYPSKNNKNYSSSEFWKKFYKPLEKPELISPNCVDGRPWNPTEKIPHLAPQALGGSLHFAVLYCLEKDLPFVLENFKTSLYKLAEKGFALGLHIDDHNKNNPEKSGCGFADTLPLTLQNTISLKDLLQKILTQKEILKTINMNEKEVEFTLKNLIEKIKQAFKKANPIFGNQLINSLIEEKGLKITLYELTGEHGEKAALINTKENSTFDTIKAAHENSQAFNLDFPYILQGSTALGINKNFAVITSLALYIATERTLRAQKKPLPVVLI